MVMPSEPPFQLAADQSAARAAADAAFIDLVGELYNQIPNAAEIRHIGATAIAGCLTKGDLDLVVRVNTSDFATTDAALASRFMRNEGSVRTDFFAASQDEGAIPPVGVQLVVRNSPLDVFHPFAERLLSDPDLIEQYNGLKRTFDGRSMAEYRAAKSAFIAAVLTGSPSEELTNIVNAYS